MASQEEVDKEVCSLVTFITSFTMNKDEDSSFFMLIWTKVYEHSALEEKQDSEN